MRKKQIAISTALVLAVIVLGWGLATASRLHLPKPTGPHAVGRTRLSWVDGQRFEKSHPQRNREVIAEIWYPAKKGTGRPSEYMPELDKLSPELAKNGWQGRSMVWLLGFVGCSASVEAEFAEMSAPSPVVIFSPGLGSNVEAYTTYAEEFASHGFVVFGVNHPYDARSVRLGDGKIAGYEPPSGDRESIDARIDVRAVDVLFLLDRLPEIQAAEGPLAGKMRLDKIVAMGHSLGGMTGAEACAADKRLSGCVNLHGVRSSNPYTARASHGPPSQPFLFIGPDNAFPEETQKLVAEMPDGKVILLSNARHSDFADTNMFRPALNPFEHSARDVVLQSRDAARDFFNGLMRDP